MAHGIMEHDALIVGFVDLYPRAWHEHPNCAHKEGAVTFEEAEEIFAYEVEKVPVVIQGTDYLIPGNYALIRKDGEGEDEKLTVVYPSVGERYTVIQNSELLAWVEAGILIPYDVSIESVGTLLNGQKAFVNIILNEHTVPGDVSATVTRLMFSNSFGGDSYQACVHTTRIVCNNTLRVASAQGATNKTLRKFRHTKNAAMKIEEHMVELADIIASTREHHAQLDLLATMKVSPEQVNAFFDALIPLPKNEDGTEKEGRGMTRRTNQREAIRSLFDEKEDLQGAIRHTRYSLLQAVTDWADHDSSVRNGDDPMGRFWDGIWGTKDKFKQTALELILAIR